LPSNVRLHAKSSPVRNCPKPGTASTAEWGTRMGANRHRGAAKWLRAVELNHRPLGYEVLCWIVEKRLSLQAPGDRTQTFCGVIRDGGQFYRTHFRKSAQSLVFMLLCASQPLSSL
jgi:hypothetical protein